MTGAHGLILAKTSRASSRVHSNNARVGKRPTFVADRPTSVAKERHKNFKPLLLTHVKSNTGGLAGFLSGVIYG